MRTPEEIESVLDRMESFLNQYDEADKAFMDKQDADNWNNKYGERLGHYSDKLKQLNGDDFDIVEASRKEYKDSYSDLTDDDYVNALEENIKKVLDRVWPEASEEQKQEVAEAATEAPELAPKTETEVETKIETDPETKEGEATSDMNAKENPDMDNTVEHEGRDGQKFWGNPRFSGGRNGKTSDENEKECPEEKETEDEDPVEAFRKELEEYKANMPKRS